MSDPAESLDTWYVALVRGVAPSTPPRNNASIVAALATLGFSGLTAVLSSGNYVFSTRPTDTGALEARIEGMFASQLGATMPTMVRTREQLRRLVDHNPLAGVPHGPGSYQLVTFFKQPVTFPLPLEPAGRAFRLAGCVDGTLFSVTDNTADQTVSLMGWLERQYTTQLTSRTPLTLQKILARMPAPAGGSAG